MFSLHLVTLAAHFITCPLQRMAGTDLYLLWTRLDFLMLHAMMLHGDSTRKAELADLCSVLLSDEGSECLGVVLRMQHYHAALRHRDPVLCPVGALAHWLVLRWEICGETLPDFRRWSSWYTTKVLPGKLSLAWKEISDDTQRNWIVPALEAVAVDSSKAVHAMCQSVARLADMWEVPAHQVAIFRYFPSTPPTNVSIDSEGGRLGTWGVGDVLLGPPAPPLYEGDGASGRPRARIFYGGARNAHLLP